MNNALWGLIGTVAGGLLTIAGTLLSTRAQHAATRETDNVKTDMQAREERKRSYLRLLQTCRQLRFIARPDHGDIKSIDELRADLSSITYEIDLIAPRAVAVIAQELAQSTRTYLRLGMDMRKRTTSERADSERVQLEEYRVAVRGLVDRFIEEARLDLSKR